MAKRKRSAEPLVSEYHAIATQLCQLTDTMTAFVNEGTSLSISNAQRRVEALTIAITRTTTEAVTDTHPDVEQGQEGEEEDKEDSLVPLKSAEDFAQMRLRCFIPHFSSTVASEKQKTAIFKLFGRCFGAKKAAEIRKLIQSIRQHADRKQLQFAKNPFLKYRKKPAFSQFIRLFVELEEMKRVTPHRWSDLHELLARDQMGRLFEECKKEVACAKGAAWDAVIAEEDDPQSHITNLSLLHRAVCNAVVNRRLNKTEFPATIKKTSQDVKAYIKSSKLIGVVTNSWGRGALVLLQSLPWQTDLRNCGPRATAAFTKAAVSAEVLPEILELCQLLDRHIIKPTWDSVQLEEIPKLLIERELNVWDGLSLIELVQPDIKDSKPKSRQESHDVAVESADWTASR